MAGGVAVDVDGVLADTASVFVEEINKKYESALKTHGAHPLTKQDLNDWGWGDAIAQLGLDDKDCLTIMRRVWRERAADIPVNDNSASTVLTALTGLDGGQVDIVTANSRVNEIQAWIENHGFPYNRLRQEHPKQHCNYAAFIDDNPVLAANLQPGQTLFLYDQPWNQDVSETNRVIRVNALREAHQYLTQHPETLSTEK